jgi:methyl-accepting chemotaxis protein
MPKVNFDKVKSLIPKPKGIQGKLLLWFLLLSLLPAAILSLLNYQISLSKLEEATTSDLKHILSGALTVANSYDDNVKFNISTKEEAQVRYRNNMLGYKNNDGTRDITRSVFALGEGFRFFAFDNLGNLIMDRYQEGKSFKDVTNSNGINAFQRMKEQGNGQFRFLWDDLGDGNEKMEVAQTTAFGPWEWIIGVSVDEDKFYAAADKILMSSLIIFVLTTLVVFGTSLLISKQFLKPILGLKDTLKEVGKGNLTARTQLNGDDELAELCEHLNKSLDAMSAAIREVVDVSQQVAASTQEMSANLEQNNSSVERVHDNVQAISKSSNDLNESSQNISSVVQELVASIEQVTATTTEVVGSTESMANSSENGRIMIGRITSQMAEIENVVSQSADQVNSLTNSSEQIAKMSSLISSIARQTNLLALNAAIEAARAGEAGKGFAVVASEVRKLAEQSGEAAKQIDGFIRTIRREVQDTVESMQQGRDTVREGSHLISESGEVFDHILDLVKTVSLQVKETSIAMSEMATGTNSTVSSVSHIVETAEANFSRARTTLDATQEQSASIGQIRQSSADLAKLADRLSETVSHFKI